MARTPVRLNLDPDRCDRCGRCVTACEPGALKVGASYIYVDWRTCNECYACAKVCDRGAITKREGSRKSGTGGARSSAKPAKPAKDATATRDRAKPAKRAKPTAPAISGPWTLLEATALLAVMFAAFMLKDALLNSASVQGMSPSSAAMARVFALMLFYGAQIATLLLLLRRRGLSFTEAFPVGRMRTSVASKAVSVGLVAALLVGARAATWIYGLIVTELGWSAPVLANGDLTQVFGPDAFGLVFAVIMVVLIGPFIEEIIFRGVLLEAFESKMAASIALFAQALLFALYHFTPWMLVPTFMLGLATGWIARARDSLWPAIVLHALYNAVPVGIAFWFVAYG